MSELKSMPLDELRAHARDVQKTADWLQSLAAEAQRAAVMARREIKRRKCNAPELLQPTTVR